MSRNWLKHAAAFVLLGCAMAAQAQTSSDQSLNELLAPLGLRAPEAHRAPQARPPTTVEELSDRVKADGHVDVIVLLALDAPFRAEGNLSRAGVQLQRNHIGAARTRLLGALPPASYSVNRDYESIPAIAMRVDEAGLAALRGSRLVAGLEEDALKFASLAQSTPLIGAPNAWASGYDGSGWTVAILDTGIEAGHPFFRNAANASRVVAEACFSKGVTAPQTASLCPNGTTTQTGSGAANANTAQCLVSGTQLCDHGTHVAGIAAGRSQTVAGQTINGVAPNANIIAIQVFTRFNRDTDCGGTGTAPCIMSYTSDQLAALNYINTTLRPSHSIASVNMSLGGGSYGAYCDTATIKTAVDNLRSNGIATVIATGNDGYRTTISSPACISTAVAVSSTSKIDVVSGFSNVATIMDLFAPGSGGAGPAPWNAGIGSSVPGSGYALMSGTSMATPQVAGAWAVLKQAAPTASVTSVLNALVTTGTPVTDTRSGASGTITKPRINVDAAAAVLTGAPTRTVTSSVGTPSGTITPTGAQTVAVNGKAGFNLYPAAGQEIDSVTGTCGGTLVGNRFTTNPVTANCTVIANFRPFSGNPLVCGTLNHSVIQNGDGSAFTLLTGLAQGYSASRLDDINLYVNGGQMWVWWYGGLGGVAAGGQISVLPAGTTVGPASTFSNANQAMNNWLPGRTGYIGMAFDNASTGQRNYGWLRMTTAGTSGYPATWHDYCYDQSGAPITTGSVPVVTYPITVSVNPAPGGSASCTPNPVTSGGNSACSASANTGYTFSSWSGDCTGATCSLTNVTSAKAVTANFTLNSYTVTATSGGNGTITPASQNVSHGGTASFTVTPATGYHVVSVSGDTCTVTGSGTSYSAANIQADCAVTATFAIDEFTVTASSGGNGTITPASQNVSHGGTASFTVTPATGYHVVSVAGDTCTVTGSGTSYSAANIQADCAVTATFAIDEFTVTASSGGNGSITPASQTVAFDGTASFTVTPATGYHVVSVAGDTCTVTGSGSSYSAANIQADCAVTATFAIDEFTVTATSGGNGTITPASQTVAFDGTASFTVTPATGYHVVSVAGDTCTVTGSGTSYSAANIQADCAVTATFAIDEFTVTATSGGNGTITPASQTVAFDGTASFTVTPATGYHVVSVAGDTCTVTGSGTSYSAANIQANCAVAATFAIDEFTVTASSGGNGSITPASQTVAFDGTASFTVTPATGYHVVSVAGDTCTVTGSGSSYSAANIQANCAVTATFAIDEFTVTASSGGNGTITPASQNVSHGGTASFTVTPATGYHVVSVTGDTCTVTGSGSSYSAANIQADCAVTATFAIDEFTVTATSGGNGTITPASQNVSHGGTASFTVTPATGYHVVSVTGDTCTVTGSGSSYSAANIQADCAVTATFAIDEFTVTASSGGNGTITPASQTVAFDGTASFTVTPATGYHVASVAGDTCTVTGSGTSYSAANIQANCAVTATFAIDEFTVTASSGGNGTITPASQNVSHGGTASFTVTPATGYHVASVAGDTCTVTGSGTSYSAANIQANCAVTATFAIDEFTVTATSGGNGTITPASQTVAFDGTASFTVTPATGYHVASVAGDTCTVTGSGTSYSAANIQANCAVTATFAIDEFTVTASSGGNGTITPASQNVSHGGTASFTVTPATGYHVVSVTGDTCTVTGSGSSYSAANIQADCAVTATFAIDEFTVTASSGGNGTITPASQTVAFDGTASFTVTPATGYHVASVAGDTCTVTGSGTSYSAANIQANCAVTATFAIDEFTVTATSGGNGTITPASQTVAFDGTASFTVTPATGYHVASVAGDTCTVTGSGTSYSAANIQANCAVTATFAIDEFTVTASSGGNGTITPASQNVSHGGTASFTVTPATGYHVVSVTGDTCTVTGSGSSYSAANIQADCAVTATFAIDEFTVTATSGGNGTITPASQTVAFDGTASFTVTPATGYHVVSVSGDTCTVTGSGTSYSAANIQADCAVTATFAIDEFTVTASSGGNGTITPASQTVAFDGTASFTVTPATGYHVVSVSGDTCTVTGSGTSYSAANIQANCAVTATFAIDEFTVTASSGGNGTITPASQNVSHGGTASFTVTPATGYHVASVAGDTCTVTGSGTSYSAANIQANCAVTATFAIDEFTVTATSGGNGTITPASQTVAFDGTASFTVTPTTGYHVVSVAGDTCTVTGSGTSYSAANIQANCAVTATFAIDEFTVTASSGGNGTITPASQNVSHGGTASFTVTPATGYHVVSVAGDTCTVTGSGSSYSAANIQADCAVTATFAIDEFTVTATSGGNGTITPASQTVAFDGTASFTVTPATGYHVASVAGDTCTVTGSGTSYSAANIQADCAVTATFAIDEFTVTATSGGNGTITPASQTVAFDGTASFTVTPATGYHVVSVAGDTCTVTGSGTSYSAANIQANCAVTATFAINQYTVTFLDWDATVLKTEQVDHGGAATAPTDPSRTGYTFAGWDVAFSNVTADLTVTAQYTINQYTVTFVDWDATVLKTEQVNHGGAATAPADPSRTGYTFSGWDVAFSNVTADLTVTAQYTINQYTVTFVDWDATVLKTEQVNHGDAATAPADPSRTGYTFAGWDVAFSNVTADLTVTAQYTINQYTLSFDSQGGSGVAPITADFGDSVTLPAAPTYAGYTFVNWNTAADGSGAPYLAGASFTMPATNTTLYAIWTVTQYTLTYTAGPNGSVDGQASVTHSVVVGGDGPQVEALPDMGWSFDIWSDGVTANPRQDTNVQSDLSVTARFTQRCDIYCDGFEAGASPRPDALAAPGQGGAAGAVVGWSIAASPVGGIDRVLELLDARGQRVAWIEASGTEGGQRLRLGWIDAQGAEQRGAWVPWSADDLLLYAWDLSMDDLMLRFGTIGRFPDDLALRLPPGSPIPEAARALRALPSY